MNFIPKKIYVDAQSRKYRLTKHILSQFPNIERIPVHSVKEFIKSYGHETTMIPQGKRELLLTTNKGAFLKKCPGTKNYICCGYQILHQTAGCHLDCSYCILQSYFNNPLLTMFVNVNDMIAELNKKLDSNKNRRWRIGTGEFTDSLAFDTITSLTSLLIPFFIKKKNAILELKTKTTNIKNLLTFRPHGKVVVAWSLNAPSIVQHEENDTATLEGRLRAAHQCQKQGYKIAFHFDPIFYYEGWESDYKRVIDMLFKHVDPAVIAWISLGCFRFMPRLKGIVEQRFPRSVFIYEEFIKGFDGKLRYIKPLRIYMYQNMIEWIKSHNSNVFMYLCMESPEVWQRSFGYTPRRFGSLTRALDNQVFSP